MALSIYLNKEQKWQINYVNLALNLQIQGGWRKMGAFNYEGLKEHIGHDIVCVEYSNGVNVAVECETCNQQKENKDEYL